MISVQYHAGAAIDYLGDQFLLRCMIAKFHNIAYANVVCSSKAKMSALSKVEMSVSAPFWESGGCHFDGHGGDEQARAEPS
jgi:hypothetical protein